MGKRARTEGNVFEPSLLNRLSAPEWDIYDIIAIVALGVFLAFYFAFHGIRTIYVHYLWGDFGWWHDLVRRYVHGEIPYKDFTWPYPPLSLYIYGWLAEAFGDSFLVLRLIPMVITVLIAFMVFFIARHCVPKKVMPLMVMASMIMGVSNSSYGGETLGIGMYTPAVPLGILLSLVCLFASIKYILTSSKHWLYLMGVGFSGALLAKQDFWMPVAVCVLIVSIYQWQMRSTIKGLRWEVIRWMLPALVLCVTGYLLVIMRAGLPEFMGSVFGHAFVGSGIRRASPTLLNVTDGFFHLSAFAILGSFLLWRNRLISRNWAFVLLVIACAAILLFAGVRLGVTYEIGSRVASGDTTALRTSIGGYFYGRASGAKQVILLAIKNVIVQALANAIPLFLSFSASIVFLWFFWKHRKSPIVKAGLLLATWIVAARMRRLFDRVDVINLLVEPLFFVLAIKIVCVYKNVDGKRCHRLIFSAAAVFFAIGISLFAFYEAQPRIRYDYEQIMTRKGSIKILADHAAEFRIAKRLIESNDPGGDSYMITYPQRYLEVLNYMLDKRAPIPVAWQVDLRKIRSAIEKYRPIVVLDRSFWPKKLVETDPQGSQRVYFNPYEDLLLSLDYQYLERPPANCSRPIFEVYVPR